MVRLGPGYEGMSEREQAMTHSLRVVLISTYELGHQPFGLASPAAWLREAGAQVTCLDLAVERLDEAAIAAADLVAFYVPMHTATRLAASFVRTSEADQPERAPLLLRSVRAGERGVPARSRRRDDPRW